MMAKAPSDSRPPVRGLFATLSAGFELASRHLWLIVLPVMLDLLFWLGPRLTVRTLLAESLETWRAQLGTSARLEQLAQLGSQTNLLTSLSVPLIGVPALMSGPIPAKTPLAAPSYDIESLAGWAFLLMVLNLIGLFLGVLYLSALARALRKDEPWSMGATLRAVPIAMVRLLGLGVAFVVVLLALMLPLAPAAALVGLASPELALLVLVIGLVIAIAFLSLAVPALIYGRRRLGAAILESLRLVKRHAGATVNVLLAMVVIGNGSTLLWQLADDGSWLTLVSILGHGFIWTGLLAAFFIFYRDRAAELEAAAGGYQDDIHRVTSP